MGPVYDSTTMVELIDITAFARLRLAVARFGEMDRAKWWNTKGMLTNVGAFAVSRGFTKTHLFARARAVFAVGAHRCDEVFTPPDGCTLWKLPAELEDQFEDAWSQWLEDPEPWTEFLAALNENKSADLLDTLSGLDVVTEQVVEEVKKLKRSNDFRSVRVPDTSELDEASIGQLAAGADIASGNHH